MRSRLRQVAARFLRLPLSLKFAGANALLLVVAVAGFRSAYLGPVAWEAPALAAIALLAGIVVNVLLVRLALSPLRDLHATAMRVWRGDLDARVRHSALADREMERVGRTFNLLLDRVLAERARIRELATQVIYAGDRQRAALSGELHDSTAQSIAAIAFQLAAAEQMSNDPADAARIAAVREATNGILEEVRMLSRSVYPRILDDLGLASALRELARTMAVDIGPTIDVEVSDLAAARVKELPLEAAAVLYRVAQESLVNALRHAAARNIALRLDATASAVTLHVDDDGLGFDLEQTEQLSSGLGLFTMRERVNLAQGQFDIVSKPGRGTTVTASVPAVLQASNLRRASP